MIKTIPDSFLEAAKIIQAVKKKGVSLGMLPPPLEKLTDPIVVLEGVTGNLLHVVRTHMWCYICCSIGQRENEDKEPNQEEADEERERE